MELKLARFRQPKVFSRNSKTVCFFCQSFIEMEMKEMILWACSTKHFTVVILTVM
jgi:hypothetical protein